MEVVAGDAQSGVVGTELSSPLVVRVRDSAGAAVSGQLVNFVMTAGGGHVFAGASITNADGLSQERWTLGTSTADSQRVEARAVDNSSGQPLTFARFQAIALAGPPQSVTKVRGDGQSGPVDSLLPDSLVVLVADQYGNPTVGVSVAWSVVKGGGTLTPTSSTTDSVGQAATLWSPGDSGADSARATVPGVAPVTFAASVYFALTYTATSAGFLASCGLTSSGAAYCWGNNRYGALGNASASDSCDVTGSPAPCSLKPIPVTGGLTFASVATGGQSSCGLSNGTAYCWGSNFSGLLGNGIWSGSNPTPQFTPLPVAGGLGFSAIDVGTHHVCALTTGGAAYCWGNGYYGALGTGTRPDSAHTPTAVIGALTFQLVDAGEYGGHTCGIVVGGAAYCWGAGDNGQLGTGEVSDTAEPVPVSGGLTFATVTTGTSHTCGLTTGGAAYCWGAGAAVGAAPQDDCLGRPCSRTPHPVVGGLTFMTIKAGSGHTCGLDQSGAAYCWGYAGDGTGGSGSALGDGTTFDRMTPVPVSGGLSFLSISAGVGHTCAVTTAGDGYCWGSNLGGQIGDASTSSSAQPRKVSHP